MAAEQTWIGSDGRAAERRQRDSSDSDGSGENMDLWKRLRKDVRNSCDNMVSEKTWLDGNVRNSNGSGQTAETVAVQIGLQDLAAVAAEQSRKQLQWRKKIGLAATEGRRQGDSKTEVTVTEAEKI